MLKALKAFEDWADSTVHYELKIFEFSTARNFKSRDYLEFLSHETEFLLMFDLNPHSALFRGSLEILLKTA